MSAEWKNSEERPATRSRPIPGSSKAVYVPRVSARPSLRARSRGRSRLEREEATGTSVDRAKGTALLERACEGGFDRECKKLGEVSPP
jgi:hypothetical protein